VIPETGIRNEVRAAVLEHCTLLPCEGEIYNIFTPFQLKHGLMPDHQWRVVKSGSQYVSVCQRYARVEHALLHLIYDIQMEEWCDKLQRGEIRYIAHDP
jgi:hypothetical protein